MAVDLSDPALQQAWATITKNDAKENWLLFDFEDGGKSSKLKVVGVGAGGLEELKSKLDDSAVQFGAFRVVGVDNRETTVSRRPKFIWFTFVGSAVPVLRKARVSVQKPDLAKFFTSAQLTMEISQLSDLSKQDIGKKLLASGGAHKPTYYEFAEGDNIQISDL